MNTRSLLLTLFIAVAFASTAIAQDLFFSEYAEGSSNNKYVEIYNGTGSEVDLSLYSVQGTNNGTAWGDGGERDTALSGTLAAGDVYVLAADAADTLILAETDLALAFESPLHYNGDDGIALLREGVIIDAIGVELDDPGTAWDVAGVANATQNHTLVRKSTVTTGNTDWAASAGTTTEDSEWEVLAEDTWDNLGSHTVVAPMVNVTFRVNASTIEGMTDSLGVVDLRGTVTQWGPGTDMTNVGGDYWEITIPLEANTSYAYKYGGSLTDIQGFTTAYWENDFPGASYQGGDRPLTTGASDTVLNMDWLGGGPDNNNPPYSVTDSVDLYFRVNMGENANFDPETSLLSIVGHLPNPAHDGPIWNGDALYRLTRESENSDYWGIDFKIAQAYMDTVESILNDAAWSEDERGMFMYRFAIDVGWDNTENLGGKYFPNNENRTVFFNNMTGDTTLAWKWWNDDAPGLAGSDSVDVTFFADLSRAVNENGFSLDDTLLVKWGYNNTGAFDEAEMVNDALTNNYRVTVNLKNVAFGEDVNYQYHKVVNGSEFEEIFFDFDETESGSAQRARKVFIPMSPAEPVLVEDNVVSNSDLHRQPRFRNTATLAQPVMVTFSVDLRPAFYTALLGVTINDIQGDIDVTDAENVIPWGVAIQGPATVGGWTDNWGASLLTNQNKVMHDDGATGGDMTAGDSIFSMQVLHSPDSTSRNIVGTEFKFGIGGGDNEAGSNFGFGLNHFENIDDSQSEFTIHSEFGSINPNYYIGWDFDNSTPILTALGDVAEIITSNELMGNYPNPFNPATKIRFNLFRQADVKLVIYDIAGKEVRTLLNGPQSSGGHLVLWNATDNRGNKVGTGVYFYRLEVGDYSKTMKMVLMK